MCVGATSSIFCAYVADLAERFSSAWQHTESSAMTAAVAAASAPALKAAALVAFASWQLTCANSTHPCLTTLILFSACRTTSNIESLTQLRSHTGHPSQQVKLPGARNSSSDASCVTADRGDSCTSGHAAVTAPSLINTLLAVLGKATAQTCAITLKLACSRSQATKAYSTRHLSCRFPWFRYDTQTHPWIADMLHHSWR